MPRQCRRLAERIGARFPLARTRPAGATRFAWGPMSARADRGKAGRGALPAVAPAARDEHCTAVEKGS